MKITGKKGEGTRVEVVLPAERGRKMWKVMAADDEAYMQQALEKLIPWGAAWCTLCRIAPNGQELVEQMELEHPDIVITDIRMPELDGLGVCKYVFEKCPEVQVIILSAYADFTYARTAIRYNACEYVLKTEVLEELPKALEKAMKALEKQKKEIQSQVFKGRMLEILTVFIAVWCGLWKKITAKGLPWMIWRRLFTPIEAT